MYQVAQGIVTVAAVLTFVGCTVAHNPNEEADRLQQLDEATGHPLAHVPGLPVSDEASNSCIEAFMATKGAFDGPDVMDETLQTCGDVPEWAYAFMTVGGLSAKAGERPLVTSLEVACYGKTSVVCRDGQERGLL